MTSINKQYFVNPLLWPETFFGYAKSSRALYVMKRYAVNRRSSLLLLPITQNLLIMRR